MRKIYFLALLPVFLLLWQCSSPPDPRKTVLDFIEAVHNSDTTDIIYYTDLDKLAEANLSTLPTEQRKVFASAIKRNVFSSLVDSGMTRLFWEECLKIVAGEKIQGDQAQVDVTFIDRKTGIKHYTKMKLYLKDGRWRIYFFEG